VVDVDNDRVVLVHARAVFAAAVYAPRLGNGSDRPYALRGAGTLGWMFPFSVNTLRGS
jgi:hypothetical protein